MIGGDDLHFEGKFGSEFIRAGILAAWPFAVSEFLDDHEPEQLRAFCVYRNLTVMTICDRAGVTDEVADSLIVVYPSATGVSFTFSPRPSETYDLVMKVMTGLNGVPST